MQNLIAKPKQLASAAIAWVMMATRPRNAVPARCGNITALLRHLCDFDDELSNWVMRWLAYPLVHPGAKMGTALVINGAPGTGKSLMFEHVVAALHARHARVIPSSRLHGQPYRWGSDARMVIIDGAFTQMDAIRLKALVACDSIVTAGAIRREIPLRHMNFAFLSTSDDFLPLALASQRFTVIEAPPPMRSGFYRAIADEIENGGIDAFHHYLTQVLDMTGFDPHTPPPGVRGWQESIRMVA